MATGNATHPPLTALLFLYYRVRVPRLPRSKRIQAKKKGKKLINQVLHQSEIKFFSNFSSSSFVSLFLVLLRASKKETQAAQYEPGSGMINKWVLTAGFLAQSRSAKCAFTSKPASTSAGQTQIVQHLKVCAGLCCIWSLSSNLLLIYPSIG